MLSERSKFNNAFRLGIKFSVFGGPPVSPYHPWQTAKTVNPRPFWKRAAQIVTSLGEGGVVVNKKRSVCVGGGETKACKYEQSSLHEGTWGPVFPPLGNAAIETATVLREWKSWLPPWVAKWGTYQPPTVAPPILLGGSWHRRATMGRWDSAASQLPAKRASRKRRLFSSATGLGSC